MERTIYFYDLRPTVLNENINKIAFIGYLQNEWRICEYDSEGNF